MSLPSSPTLIADLWRFPLRVGNSPDPSQGACLLDAVSWLEYGHLGDAPGCVCPVIAAWGRFLNDLLPAEQRQGLRAYIPRLVGTVERLDTPERVTALALHVVNAVLPLALDQGGHAEAAALCRATATIEHARGVFSRASWMTYALPLTEIYRGCANARRDPILAVNHLIDAMQVLFPYMGEALFPPALAGLDLLLSIGRQADPAPVARWREAADAFALARDAVPA